MGYAEEVSQAFGVQAEDGATGLVLHFERGKEVVVVVLDRTMAELWKNPLEYYMREARRVLDEQGYRPGDGGDTEVGAKVG